MANGKNPAFERDAQKQTRAIAAQNMFEAVALEWYPAQLATWSTSHASRVKKQLDREVISLIGKRPISSIGTPDLLTVIRRIEGREAFETLQTCGEVFRYAVATSRAERDPSPDLRGALKAVPVKHMARVSEVELPELLRSIAAYEGEPETRLALRLLALTFVRTMCWLLRVSHSGFYEWLGWTPSKRLQENVCLTRLVRESFELSDKTYGSPCIWHDLRASRRIVGWPMSNTSMQRWWSTRC